MDILNGIMCCAITIIYVNLRHTPFLILVVKTRVLLKFEDALDLNK